jgi:hypothetical protein
MLYDFITKEDQTKPNSSPTSVVSWIEHSGFNVV